MNNLTAGEFIDIDGERYYAIANVDKMEPFFISVVSNLDHWLFISSRGGLTAGRVSPDTALFPYVTVDKIHENAGHTGSKTVLRLNQGSTVHYWEPFNVEHDHRYTLSRNLYKSLPGNKICFEEINHTLQLTFRYSWSTSEQYGFVRQCTLSNLGDKPRDLEILDGIQNILPAGTPLYAQTNTSNLVDAYKWTELDTATGLAYFTLYSGISDRAEPCESLKATTVFCLGLENHKILLSSKQLDEFRGGAELSQEIHKRGIRGAYLVNQRLMLGPQETKQWLIIADVEHSQSDVVTLRKKLANESELGSEILSDVNNGTAELKRIMASSDAYQVTSEELVTVHHYANTLFNVLRGGVFAQQYQIFADDFIGNIRHFNKNIWQRHRSFLEALPEQLGVDELLSAVKQQNDTQLERLAHEYLPITFGRRHGDPSRPWNMFAIKVKDEQGNDLLSYQGNWRDIFQNWEALLFSYPGFIESVIAKFVNASTVDGYNPYRITKEGIDWEVEELDNPWSHIGYWGDHQIIYLLKLLELSNDFHPERLQQLLEQEIFCYANVPYRIAGFDALLENPKNSVSFDEELASCIEKRVDVMGADGKLLLNKSGEVYQVNLMEKLLVPLLAKLGNLVVDGGIWLTTQRPEWNDANNALVGQGLSMVTLYYMRRYVHFLQQLLNPKHSSYSLSKEVHHWLTDTTSALLGVQDHLGDHAIPASARYAHLAALGKAAARYRQRVYEQESLSGPVTCSSDDIKALLESALVVIDHSIRTNQRQEDGLYHAYNLLDLDRNTVSVDTLYPMLEGQVAVLSSGVISPRKAVAIVEALFNSSLYRADQKSFILYPDRELPGFLDKNLIPYDRLQAVPLLDKMLSAGDKRIVERDLDDGVRFNANFTNNGDLRAALDSLHEELGEDIAQARESILELYEQVFQHKSFTGRSGTMFGFEGLGSIYWHMVSKLLLAVMENFFNAVDKKAPPETCQRLAQLYYQVREGIGFNKTPADYGAFPTDPYSHTPKHSGAKQPGMTGQVKEEILTRFGELGVRVHDGVVNFKPALLRELEFLTASCEFDYLDVDGAWQTIWVPKHSLAFTWCQVPVIYTLDDASDPGVTLLLADDESQVLPELGLNTDFSTALFARNGQIRQITVTLNGQLLFSEQ